MNTNPEPTPAVEKVARALWNHMKLVGCSKGFHEGASDPFESAEPDMQRELRGYAIAALSSLPSEREQIVAWLRGYEHGLPLALAKQAADQIEAGAHLPTTEQEEGKTGYRSVTPTSPGHAWVLEDLARRIDDE